MAAFERARPHFVYSLHNAGFGGVYYYTSREISSVVEAFHAIPGHLGMTLSLGEPEVPWARQYAPAIFQTTGVREAYDYYARIMPGDPAGFITGGASSWDYLQALGSPFCLITEVPYFQCREVADTTLLEVTRREVLLEGAERAGEMLSVLRHLIVSVEKDMTEDTRFWRASSTFVQVLPRVIEAKARWAADTPETAVPATVAQHADELYVSKFYRVLVASMLRRAFDAQLRAQRSAAVARARDQLDAQLGEWIADIDANLHYRFAGIRRLVQVQYAVLLAALRQPAIIRAD